MKQPNAIRLKEMYAKRFCFNNADIRYIFDDICYTTAKEYMNKVEVLAMQQEGVKPFPPNLVPRKRLIEWLCIEEEELKEY